MYKKADGKRWGRKDGGRQDFRAGRDAVRDAGVLGAGLSLKEAVRSRDGREVRQFR